MKKRYYAAAAGGVGAGALLVRRSKPAQKENPTLRGRLKKTILPGGLRGAITQPKVTLKRAMRALKRPAVQRGITAEASKGLRRHLIKDARLRWGSRAMFAKSVRRMRKSRAGRSLLSGVLRSRVGRQLFVRMI